MSISVASTPWYEKVGNTHVFFAWGTSVRWLVTDIKEWFVDLFGGRLKSIESSMEKATKRAIDKIKEKMLAVLWQVPDGVDFKVTQSKQRWWAQVLVTAVVPESVVMKKS